MLLVFALLLTLLNSTFSSAAISRGVFSQVTDYWGSNPTNTGFYIYVPRNLASNPGIVVAVHYCKPGQANIVLFSRTSGKLIDFLHRHWNSPSILSGYPLRSTG